MNSPCVHIRKYRKLYFLLRRIINKFWSIWNLLRLQIFGCEIGNHCVIHGHLGLSLSPYGRVLIGKCFYMSNGMHINPLCANNEGHIHVEDSASLVIGDNVAISSTRIWCTKHIQIKDNVKIGGGCIIIDTDAHSMDFHNRREIKSDNANKRDEPVIIGHDVFVGMNTIILKGVEIGDRCIIGAGSVVTKSIPSDCVAAGNPAKVIRKINQQ